MRTFSWISLVGLAAQLFASRGVLAIDVVDTKMLTLPAVSERHVAFGYGEDLWICDRDGNGVRRLTSHEGVEFNPRFSPDGRHLAFSGQYDGNVDVYLVPVEGGVPSRLTWHPGQDTVQDFTRDGKRVLFTSKREVYTTRFAQLYEVPLTGGHPEKLSIPNASKACFSPDGKKIAYTPLYEAFNQWKNYRGGTATRIWLYDRGDHSIVEIPQPKGRCNDTDPMWIGDLVYFRSDRKGEFNLFSYDPESGSIDQLTRHVDFPVLTASGGSDAIIYEQAGHLHRFDLENGTSARMKIGVPADLVETRPRFVSGNRFVRSADLSPSGVRAVLGYRGEIISVPKKKGAPRNLSRSSGAHDHSPAWSPDAKWIAYFSDESGEYELHVVRQGGSGGKRKFELQGAGFYDSLTWSPDSKKVSYSDNSWSLYFLDLESGDVKKISTEPIYGPIKTLTHSWSPDSQWIAYTRITETYFQRIYIYSLGENQSYVITDGLSDVGDPVFDRNGEYLYVTSSTDAGPVRQWFAMSNSDIEMTNSLYLIVLANDEPSPLAPESDEEDVEETEEEAKDAEPEEEPSEEASADDADADAEAKDEAKDASNDGEKEADEKPVRIDFDRIENRIVAIPVESAFYSSLVGGEKKVYYLKSMGGRGLFGSADPPSLYRFDLGSREEEKIAAGVNRFVLSNDGENILVGSDGGSLSIVAASPGADLGKGRLDLSAVKVRVDPAEEWRQIFAEAWRINRDYFYAPNMHGADWKAMRARYEPFLSHLAVRSDLNRVIGWMCSELAVGHHRVGGGDRRETAKTVPGGLLGADFEIDSGRYRFRKIYGGLNWNPNLRSPLTEPGVDVTEGEYLLEVDGRDLRAPDSLYRFFENTAGVRVELTVGKSADGEDSRSVFVVPVRNEASLRNRDWVESNIRKVHEATDGRVAYVYVPNTTSLGHTYFKRYFFPQADKQAIIIDERHNGGGQVADYYIDLLNRPDLCYWATRYGRDFKTPLSSIQGPKVMLIDETAGSGGDLLPWMFRKLKLGKLIGRPTWGGLVGTLGFPPLMDGGVVTAPNLAIWTEDGFVVENVGVPPDIEIEQTPAEVIAGKDPQLDKAIEVILEELRANPPVIPTRPPFPVRARR